MGHHDASHHLMRPTQVLNEVDYELGGRCHDDHTRAEYTPRNMVGYSSPDRVLFVGIRTIVGRQWKSHGALTNSKMGLSAYSPELAAGRFREAHVREQ